MSSNYGKKFETQVKTDLERCFPGAFLLRLPDQQSGYFGTSQNICDFIMFVSGQLFLIECKSHKGNTFPLNNLTQFGKLSVYKDLTNVNPGVIIWYIDHDVVAYIPIQDIIGMVDDGKKSINIKDVDQYKLPSLKKRTFMETDYSSLLGGGCAKGV